MEKEKISLSTQLLFEDVRRLGGRKYFDRTFYGKKVRVYCGNVYPDGDRYNNCAPVYIKGPGSSCCAVRFNLGQRHQNGLLGTISICNDTSSFFESIIRSSADYRLLVSLIREVYGLPIS